MSLFKLFSFFYHYFPHHFYISYDFTQIHEHEVLIETAPYEVDPLVDSQPIAQWRLEKDLRLEEEKFTEEEQVLYAEKSKITFD